MGESAYQENERLSSDSPKKLGIGDRIARIREEKGMSQTAIAKKFGVSQQSWANYEKEQTMPRADMLANLVSRYQITADWLLLGEGPMWREDAPKAEAGQQAAAPDAGQREEIERLRAQVEVLKQTLVEIDRDRATRRAGEETGFTATATEPEPAAG